MDHTFFAPLDSALHQNETSTHHFLAVALKYFLTGLLFDDRGNSAASSKTAGWGARIRTWEWRNQNPLPYHLATPQCLRAGQSTQVRLGFNAAMAASKAA
jgi:hypothetical protein